MRKLGILFLILGLTVVNRWLLALVPPLAPMVREPETYAMVLALQAALLFAGGVMVFLPLVWRRGPAGLPAAGILLAIPVALFVHQWALERRMPDMVQRLKSRWDGSYLHHYSDAYLERVSVWAMGLDERREGVKAVKMHLPIGEYLLRLGRVPEALEHFKRAYGIASNHPKGTELLPDAARALGMAYLRAGEIESCLDQPNPESCVFPLQGGGVWTRTEDAERAAKLFEQVLELSPGDPGARWLLAVANQAAGREPEVRLEGVSLPEWMVRGEVDAPRFTNLAGPLGVGEDDLAGSVLMEDFDGDGFVDIITCSYDPGDPLTYHHNEGDGTFSDWTARAGLSEQKGGLNLTLADYDNDGRTDILVLRGAWFLSDGYQRNSLLRQQEDGSFVDVTVEAGLAEVDYPCLAAAWADYDLDGDLDVYIGNERLKANVGPGGRQQYAPSQLFRNNGDGTFTDVAEEAGVVNGMHARGVAWGDFDNDGDPDLAVSNLLRANRIYRNEGDGTFTDLAALPGNEALALPRRAFGCWWLDANNDGWLDLFVSTYPLTDRVDDVMNDRFGGERGDNVEPCALFLNDGAGGFEDVTEAWGLDRVHLTMGANIGDVDGDGWMDMYLGTGAPAFEIIIPNILYRNMGGERFADATIASGLGHLQKGHGIAFADIDNDGDLDTYAQLGGWYVDSTSQNAMFLNEGIGPNRGLSVDLVGSTANRGGMGARLTAVVADGSGGTREIHLVAGGTGSFGGNATRQYIGVGTADRVGELRIQWPDAARTVQVVRDLPTGGVVRIRQGEEGFEVLDLPALDFEAAWSGR